MERHGEHPAGPEQPEEGGFEEGSEQLPDNEHVGSFAEGEETLPHDHERKRRFSEGVEETPDAPEDNAERDFGEGIERPKREP